MRFHAPPHAPPPALRQGSRAVVPAALPSLVVVDPRFDAYGPLAESARQGRLSLHFRGSGRDALRLAQKRDVDAWLVAAELDDMSGHDFVELLRRQRPVGHDNESKLLMVDSASPGGRQWSVKEREATASGADGLLSHPITFEDLEKLLGLPVEERSRFLAMASGMSRAFVTLPVGVGAAAIAMALLFAG